MQDFVVGAWPAVLIRGIIMGIIRIPTTSWDKRGKQIERNKSKRVFARSKAIEFRQVTHWTSSRVAYCSVARWQCCTCNLLCVGRISRRRRCAAAAQRRVLSPARVARVSPSMSSCRRSIVEAHYKLLEAIGLHGLQRWYRPLICGGACFYLFGVFGQRVRQFDNR